jgi:hypothetical protein
MSTLAHIAGITDRPNGGDLADKAINHRTIRRSGTPAVPFRAAGTKDAVSQSGLIFGHSVRHFYPKDYAKRM